MSVEQYLEVDSAASSHDIMSDREIVEEVSRRFDPSPLPPNDVDSEEEIVPQMTAKQGKEMLEGALVWCEQQEEEDIDAEFLKKLRRLARKATLEVAKQRKQQKIDSFFVNNKGRAC